MEPSVKRPRLDAAEVKAMSAKQYMDELVVPMLLKGLSACNKQVRKCARGSQPEGLSRWLLLKIYESITTKKVPYFYGEINDI